MREEGSSEEEARSGPFVYAVSWWRKDAVDEYLRDPSLPIWKSLQRERRELYREIVDVQLGYSAALQEAFGGGVGEPMWARTVGFDVDVDVDVGGMAFVLWRLGAHSCGALVIGSMSSGTITSR